MNLARTGAKTVGQLAVFAAALSLCYSMSGSVITNANDVIDVDVSVVADVRHSVNLISFTSGTATVDNFRVVPANPLYLFKVSGGKVRLSCLNGTQVLFS